MHTTRETEVVGPDAMEHSKIGAHFGGGALQEAYSLRKVFPRAVASDSLLSSLSLNHIRLSLFSLFYRLTLRRARFKVETRSILPEMGSIKAPSGGAFGYDFEDQQTRLQLELIDDLQKLDVSKSLDLPQVSNPALPPWNES